MSVNVLIAGGIFYCKTVHVGWAGVNLNTRSAKICLRLTKEFYREACFKIVRKNDTIMKRQWVFIGV